MDIIVVEDDVDIAELVAFNLERQGWRCRLVHHGGEGWAQIQRQHPDLVILDVMLPGMDGMQIFRAMKENEMTRGIPAIFLTARGALDDRLEGLSLGADDYVVKPFSIAELLARVAAVLRRSPGRQLAVAQVLQFPGGTLDGETRRAQFDDGSPLPLTEKEFELFRYFLTHPGRVIPQEELLLRVWGSRNKAAQTRTVAVTLTRLREKLGPIPAACIETIRGRGYRWNEV